jgi:galactose oxidase-like protein
MTSQNGFDRTLSDWLAAENAPDVPEWVYEGAFVEVRTTGQSRPLADALTRWLRPRDTLPGPRPQGMGRRSTVGFATPVILVVALLIIALVTAALLVGASRLLPDRLIPTNGFHAVGSIGVPGAGVPGTLTALPDGRAVVTNGTNLDVFDPASGQFVRSDSHLTVDRQGEAATLLHDGTVLIVGGGAADRAVPASGGSVAEVFDPATGTVTQVGPTLEPHTDALATLLADGRVLIAGGADPHRQTPVLGEIYDPETQTFGRTADMTDVWGSTNRTVPLDDGRALIVGGRIAADGGIDKTADLFDPETGQLSATGPMAINQRPWTATRLSDGRVLLLGGFEWDPVGHTGAPTDAAQIYDPETGTFKLAGRMPTPRIGHSAVLLDDGDVLIMGGQAGGKWDPLEVGPRATGSDPVTDALRWDHGTGEFVPADPMSRWRTSFLATRLLDGRVLMIGHSPWRTDVEPPPAPSDEELQSVWSADVFE